MSWLFNKDNEAIKKRQEARVAGLFSSRASIFNYLYTVEGLDFEEAKKIAIEMAEIMGVPDKEEPKLTGFKNLLENCKEAGKFIEDNPKTVEVVTPILVPIITAVVGAIGGAFIAKKVDDKPEEQKNYDNSEPTVI